MRRMFLFVALLAVTACGNQKTPAPVDLEALKARKDNLSATLTEQLAIINSLLFGFCDSHGSLVASPVTVGGGSGVCFLAPDGAPLSPLRVLSPLITSAKVDHQICVRAVRPENAQIVSAPPDELSSPRPSAKIEHGPLLAGAFNDP